MSNDKTCYFLYRYKPSRFASKIKNMKNELLLFQMRSVINAGNVAIPGVAEFVKQQLSAEIGNQ
jgi:hypothetical protein